jgi:hypothetical protein
MGPGADQYVDVEFGGWSRLLTMAGFSGIHRFTDAQLHHYLAQLRIRVGRPITQGDIDRDLSLPPAIAFAYIWDDASKYTSRPYENPDPKLVPPLPTTKEDMIAFFAKHGTTAPQKLMYGARLRDSAAFEEHLPSHLTLYTRWHHLGGLYTIDVLPGTHPKTTRLQDAYALFKWDDGLGHYYPTAISDGFAAQWVFAWLEAQGVPIRHNVERSYVLYALGFKQLTSKKELRYRMDSLEDYFKTGSVAGHLIPIASRIDPRFARAHSAVRLSFITNPTRGEYHGMKLEPWDITSPWEWERLEARFLFEDDGGTWRLRRHSGQSSETYASYIRQSLESRLHVVIRSGNIPISWPELVQVMSDSVLRRILFRTLWERDNPGKPFPNHFVFQSSKHGKSARRPESMVIIDAAVAKKMHRSPYLAWLWFDRNHEGDVLTRAEGRNSSELMEPFFTEQLGRSLHPVEIAVMLRMYNDKTTVFNRSVLTPELVLVFFRQMGRQAVRFLLEDMRAVKNQPHMLPEKLQFAGKIQRHDGITVNGLRFQEGGYQKKAYPDSSVVAVEWTLSADGEYEVTQTSGALGKRIGVAATADTSFKNHLEEAMAQRDPAMQAQFLSCHPITIADIETIFREMGPEAIALQWQIYRLAHNPKEMSNPPPHLWLHIELHRTGWVKSVQWATTSLYRSESVQHVDMEFVWHQWDRHYIPQKVWRINAVRLADALLAHLGFRLDDVASRALADEAMGYEGRARRQLEPLIAQLRTEGTSIANHLLPLACKLNPNFWGTPSELRLSLGITADGSYSSVRLEPWGAQRQWEHGNVRANLLLQLASGEWRLIRFSGPSSEKVATAMATAPVIQNRGYVTLSWDDLKRIMHDPHHRQDLVNTLWHRDHPEQPLSTHYIFQAQKMNEAGITMAYSLTVLDSEQVASMTRDSSYAWLRFEPSSDGAKRLAHIEGSNVGELAEPVLAGDGHSLKDPVDRVLVLRMLSDGLITKSDPSQGPVTLQDIRSTFMKHGGGIVEYLITTARIADPNFPGAPQRLLLTGLLNGKAPATTVIGLTLQSEGDLHSLGHSYFGVQFERVSAGRYDVTDAQRGLGRELAQIYQSGWKGGGQTIAPDADAKERVAAEVAKSAQTPGGFASIDPMSRPEPMITPAELKQVKPLETLPVILKNNDRGFAPSVVAWKDLALRPSDKRFVGYLPESSAFEKLFIWAVALATGAWAIRSMPMGASAPVFNGGALFVTPSDMRHPEEI